MEELSLGSVLSNEMNLTLVANGLEDGNGLSDQMIPFLDPENASVLLKSVGIFDPNGTFYIDPTQFSNFILDSSNIFPTHLTIQMVPSLPTSLTSTSAIITPTSTTTATTSTKESTPTNIAPRIEPNNCRTPLNGTLVTIPTTSIPTPVTAPVIARKLATEPVPSSSKSIGLPIPTKSSKPIPTKSLSNTTGKKVQPGKKLIPNDDTPVEPPIGKGPFKCQICSKVFVKFPQFKRHKAEHMDEKTYKCQLCSVTFNYDENLRLHMMVHEAESSGCLQCQVCPAKFSRLASLKSHLRVHEKEDNVVCQECGDEFPTKNRLDTHLEEHRSNRLMPQQCLLHRCRLCGKNFSQSALLKDHLREHAEFRKELNSIASSRRRKVKGKPGGLESYIKRLKEKDPNSKPKPDKKKTRACHLCEKKFEKPSQLSRHLRIHTGEKPFVCTQCGKSFNQKGTLESHVQATHDKKKPFVCHLCSCTFSQRGNLKAHVLKVHVPAGENEKVFKCFECSCVYRRLATLNNHIAKTHSVQPARLTEPDPETGDAVLRSDGAPDPKDSPSSIGNRLNLSFMTPMNSCALPGNGTQPQFNSKNMPSTPYPAGSGAGGNESISEVTLAHREQGKSGRCLVKIKKIGHVKWHLCHFCSKTFKKPSDLIRHTRIHTFERPFTCEICGKSFAVKSTLNTHLRTHLSVKELECRVCRKGFSMLSSLKAHERLHTGVKPFQCMQCGKAFRTSTQRSLHLKVHSRNSNATGLSGKRKLLRIGEGAAHVDLPDPLKITSDGLVPVPNRAVQALIRNGAQEGRVYKCPQCPSGFKKSSHLKQHLRSHTGDRPYKCFQCLRSFVSSGVLKNHIKTHEGVRAFKCTVCSISFTTNGSLTRHSAIHTSARPYVCPYCHKTFKTSVSCRKHIKTHRSEIVQFHSIAEGSNGTASSSNNNNNTNHHSAQLEQIQQTTPQTQAGNQQSTNQGQSYAGGNQDFNQASRFGDNFSGVVSVDLGPAPNMTLLPNGTIVSRMQETTLNSSTLQQSLSVINSVSNTTGIQTFQQDSGAQMHSTTCTISTLPNVLQGFANENGLLTLQYTVTQCDTGQRNELDAASQALFDQTLFSLQELNTPLAFLTDSQESSNRNTNLHVEGSGQISTFNFNADASSLDLPVTLASNNTSTTQLTTAEVQSLVDKIVLTTTAGQAGLLTQTTQSVNATEPRTTTVDDADGTRDTNVEGEAAESDEVRKIRETSRPISEKIYNELKAQEKILPRAVDLTTSTEATKLENLNECQFCTRAFKKRSDLQRHLRIHTGEKPFRCQICGKVFRVKSTREAHMRTHVGGKSVSCHMCNNLFATKSSLRVHLRIHTGDKPYQCPFCDRFFRTSGHRKAHILSHMKHNKRPTFPLEEPPNPKDPNLNNVHHQFSGNEKKQQQQQQRMALPPVETIKGSKTSAAASAALAAAQQELDNISACLAAAASSSSGENGGSSGNNTDGMNHVLGNVQLSMEGPSIQLSGLDLNSLQMDDNFLQNVANVIFIPPAGDGEDGNDDELDGGSQNIVMLPDISADLLSGGISEKDESSLSHIVSNSDLSDFSALNIASSGEIDVSEYILSHSDELDHGTTPSTSSGNTTKKGKTKVRKVSGNKICRYCGKSFAKPSLLSRHLRVHTGEKPYLCAHCPRTFSQKSSLDSHLYVHTNERPFACGLCPFRTVQRAALRKHFVRAHPNHWEKFGVAEQDQKDFDNNGTTTEANTNIVTEHVSGDNNIN